MVTVNPNKPARLVPVRRVTQCKGLNVSHEMMRKIIYLAVLLLVLFLGFFILDYVYVVHYGNWECLICGKQKEEDKTFLFGIRIGSSVEFNTVVYFYEKWYQDNIGMEHEHYWVGYEHYCQNAILHSTVTTNTFELLDLMEVFHNHMTMTPKEEALYIMRHLINSPSEQKEKMLMCFSKGKCDCVKQIRANNFASLTEAEKDAVMSRSPWGQVLSVTQYKPSYELWIKFHPIWQKKQSYQIKIAIRTDS